MAKIEYMQSTFCSDLKPRARLVLQCLILHSNKEGTCFPSIKTIAAECGYGVTTVKRALDDLLEAGYIQKAPRFDERKNGGSYQTVTGEVKRIDAVNGMIQMADRQLIPIADVFSIEIIP